MNIRVLCALLCVATLAACGGNGGSDPVTMIPDPDPPPQTPEPDPDPEPEPEPEPDPDPEPTPDPDPEPPVTMEPEPEPIVAVDAILENRIAAADTVTDANTIGGSRVYLGT